MADTTQFTSAMMVGLHATSRSDCMPQNDTDREPNLSEWRIYHSSEVFLVVWPSPDTHPIIK